MNLDLNYRSLNKITDDITNDINVKSITKLNINGNHLSGIDDELCDFENLKFLYAEKNEIQTISEKIKNLKHLKFITLRGNKLKFLPDNFSLLVNLEELHLNNNEFEEFPIQLLSLKNLKYLYLGGNHISKIPKEITQLENLVYLGLNNNRIQELPAEIVNLVKLSGLHTRSKKERQKLNVLENPLKSPPLEIATNGLEAIKDFFTVLNRADEIRHLYEAKLILVGEGEVGKTSLAKVLLDTDYQLSNEERTQGIEINDWDFPLKINNTDSIKLHIWDFGGQEIYHSTHQFFLTTRSIYLYVLNPRREDNLNLNYYWLNIIRLLGGNSPVIVVINKSDVFDKEYSVEDFVTFNNNITSIVKTSCKQKFGINALIEEIYSNIKKLDHIGIPFDIRWLDIRNNLLKLKENLDYISYQEFEKMCKESNIVQSDIAIISEIFHSLGIFLHYKNDIYLENFIILNHEWATSAVYKILDNQKIRENNGIFDDVMLNESWNEIKFRYKKAELLALMKKFELCFEIDNSNLYLAPQLLPKHPIQFEWNYKGNVIYEMKYDFMPKGILSTFIVKRNIDIHERSYWLNGVVLKYNSTKALLVENVLEKKIRINIDGEESRFILNLIKKTLYEINKKFHNLKVKELIGCICSECKKSINPYAFEISDLKNAEQKKIQNIQCQKSFSNIPLAEVLELVFEKKEGTDNIKGSFFENLIYSLLISVYPHSDIIKNKKIGQYEYDFIIISNAFKEIIVLETKGYKATKSIDLGDSQTKETVNWFFRNTFPIAQKELNLKNRDNVLLQEYTIKACYIASCNFSKDAENILEDLNKSKLKPSQMDIFYNREKLIGILKNKGLHSQVKDLERYYVL